MRATVEVDGKPSVDASYIKAARLRDVETNHGFEAGLTHQSRRPSRLTALQGGLDKRKDHFPQHLLALAPAARPRQHGQDAGGDFRSGAVERSLILVSRDCLLGLGFLQQDPNAVRSAFPQPTAETTALTRLALRAQNRGDRAAKRSRGN